MELSYVLNAIGAFGDVVIEIPLTKQQAGELILDAIAGGQIKAEVPNIEPEEPEKEPQTRGGKKKGKRKCGNCGGTGHTARTCDRPAGSAVSTAKLEDENEKLPENSQLQQIRELLKGGKSDDEVAIDTGTSIRTIKYIRKQMVGRMSYDQT
jgi:hypothetical protein